MGVVKMSDYCLIERWGKNERMLGRGDVASVTRSGRIRSLALRSILVASPLIYVLLWNLIVKHHLLSLIMLPFRLISSSVTAEWAKVQVGARPEAVVWRMGTIPVYWSEIGNLQPFHTLFSATYLFYIATSIFPMGWILNLNIQKKITFLNFNFVKRFWLGFGVIAFLTTTLSTVAFVADLLSLIYYVMYLVSLPMVPISLYLWGKKAKKTEKE
jgi:hypothetical protein